MKIGKKSDLEPTWVDCISDFWHFGERPKKQEFLIPLQWPKKSEKSVPGGPRRRQPGHEGSAGIRFLGIWGPGAATRATSS